MMTNKQQPFVMKNCDLHFDDFYVAIARSNDLEKFIRYLFKDNKSVQRSLNDLKIDKISSNEAKIRSMIEFLKTIEPKFGILSFDFTNPDYIESSSILLYTNLLDFFFLKKSNWQIQNVFDLSKILWIAVSSM